MIDPIDIEVRSDGTRYYYPLRRFLFWWVRDRRPLPPDGRVTETVRYSDIDAALSHQRKRHEERERAEIVSTSRIFPGNRE